MSKNFSLQKEDLDFQTYDEIRISRITDESLNLTISGSDLLIIELALLKVSNEGNKWLQEKTRDVLERIHKEF